MASCPYMRHLNTGRPLDVLRVTAEHLPPNILYISSITEGDVDSTAIVGVLLNEKQASPSRRPATQAASVGFSPVMPDSILSVEWATESERLSSVSYGLY